MTIAIRVSTKAIYVMGHFMRCLYIRNHLNSNVIWFIDDRNKSLEARILKEIRYILKKNLKSMLI